MRLSEVLPAGIAAPPGTESILVTGITAASAAVGPGAIFAGLPGSKIDGASFAADAIERGAKAIVVGKGSGLSVPQGVALIEVENPRAVLAKIAAKFAGKQPRCAVAVTGTSGKTSVADFTRQIFSNLGHSAASIGTIGIVKPGGAVYGSLTTPDPVTLHAMLAELAAEGVTHLAFEASSHGLDQHRLDGVTLSAAAFTNLGRDHMDYHSSVDAYLNAKLRLFTELLEPGQPAVINADGAEAGKVSAAAKARGLRLLTVGMSGEALKRISLKRDGFQQVMEVVSEGRTYDVRLPLVGGYQAENALVAAGLAIAIGERTADVLAALSHLKGVPGRLEIAGERNGGLVVIDYAHKPEALAAALEACRPFVTGRLISVFGCGGDRDQGKRPIMGRISIEKADVTIVTDDNPRTEEAAEIRRQILAGAPGAREIGDRSEAIQSAMAMMTPGDVVLVAGKGHETGQIIGDRIVPFSDHDEVRRVLQGRELMQPLWSWLELSAALGTDAEGATTRGVTGVSIDTRTLRAGDLFVALKDQRDGHDFVTSAFEAGAAAALVSGDYRRAPGDGALFRVSDTLKALEALAHAARQRLSANARVIAVTGSAGKTGTKEMLRACLERLGPTHASEKSYNNHWGVPLTLARMPRDTRYAVLEVGMNHAGEIRPLTQMIRPHAAIITTVEAVHLEYFASVEAIADAKAEIFEGLMPGDTAIIKSDNPHAARLKAIAKRLGTNPLTFGFESGADVRGDGLRLADDGAEMAVHVNGQTLAVHLAMPGRHIAENALAVIAALSAIGADVKAAVAALANLRPPVGRGDRTLLHFDGGDVLLIDESYNANPASMRAALATLGAVPRQKFLRRIAVLGDMLELGSDAPALHAALQNDVKNADIDLVFACGPLMKGLYDALPEAKKGGYALSASSLEGALQSSLRGGDVVMVKASNGTRLGPIVMGLKAQFKDDAPVS